MTQHKENINMNSKMLLSVSEAVACRRSCRDFLSKDVSIDLVMKILNEARRAPSSGNLQPWKIYLLYGETKTKLANIMQAKLLDDQIVDLPSQFTIFPSATLPFGIFAKQFKKNYPKYYQRHSDLGRNIYTSWGIKRADKEGRKKMLAYGYDFFGAPVGLLFTIKHGMSYGQYPDLGILLATIMLLCEQYELSTCTQVIWALQHQTLRNVLNIATDEVIFCGMAIGYKNKEAKVNQFKQERMELNEMVVVPQIADNIQIPSKLMFKLKLGGMFAKYYISNMLPLMSIAVIIMLLLVVYYYSNYNQ